MSAPSGSTIGQLPGCTDRIVKYIANSPAKNISSLESHTIVPTLTTFGRVSEWILLPKPGAVAVDVTGRLWPARTGNSRRGVGGGVGVRGRAPAGAFRPRYPPPRGVVAGGGLPLFSQSAG